MQKTKPNNNGLVSVNNTEINDEHIEHHVIILQCPNCGEELEKIIKCPFCGEPMRVVTVVDLDKAENPIEEELETVVDGINEDDIPEDDEEGKIKPPENEDFEL